MSSPTSNHGSGDLPDPQAVKEFLEGLQDRICAALEGLDGESLFRREEIPRPGGGVSRPRVLEGSGLLEKAAVHFTQTHGAEMPPAATLPATGARRTDLRSPLGFADCPSAQSIHPDVPREFSFFCGRGPGRRAKRFGGSAGGSIVRRITGSKRTRATGIKRRRTRVTHTLPASTRGSNKTAMSISISLIATNLEALVEFSMMISTRAALPVHSNCGKPPPTPFCWLIDQSSSGGARSRGGLASETSSSIGGGAMSSSTSCRIAEHALGWKLEHEPSRFWLRYRRT